MKISHDDRLKLKLWLEKDPSSDEKGKNITVDNRLFARRTEYFGEWKVRIAYDVETNYPLIMSSPIPAEQDSNKQDVAPKVMVAKLPKKAAPAKPKAKSILEEITGANPSAYFATQLWDWGVKKPAKPPAMPAGVSYKAVKGSKALYGDWSTIYVKVGYTIPGQYYNQKLKLMSVPKGFHWVKASSAADLWTLVKK